MAEQPMEVDSPLTNSKEITKTCNDLRMYVLRHQHAEQATSIVSILRMFLLDNNYDDASDFVEHINFPESAHNNYVARWKYYQGCIKAQQMAYADASILFQQALRKAPQDVANGFKQHVNKWVVVVKLLQGEIPERNLFDKAIFREPLAPYLKITEAVRLGAVERFDQTVSAFQDQFSKDKTYTLVIRLRQNVIRAAIRKISMVYSVIPIRNVAEKLQIEGEVEAEYMTAKAIRDHVIKGLIFVDGTGRKCLECKEPENVYLTTEPQLVFDSKIKECLALHDQAVKALRYPLDTKKGEGETIEEQREREQLAIEMAEEEDDDMIG